MTDDARQRSTGGRGVARREDPVETYDTEGGTVLYDAGNPLAWIESSHTVPMDEAA